MIERHGRTPVGYHYARRGLDRDPLTSFQAHLLMAVLIELDRPRRLGGRAALLKVPPLGGFDAGPK